MSAPPTYRPQHPEIAVWRPATAGDVDAVLEAYRGIDSADHPNYLTSREQVEEELGYSFVDLERDTLLAVTAEGRVVAVGIVMEPPRQETLVREFMNGGVHPEFRGRGIGRELLAWQRARGRRSWPRRTSGCPGGSSATRIPARGRRRLLEAGGFEVVRYFQTMERDLSAPIPAVSPKTEVRIDRYATELADAVHAARDDAFRDHWGSQPLGRAVRRADVRHLRGRPLVRRAGRRGSPASC